MTSEGLGHGAAFTITLPRESRAPASSGDAIAPLLEGVSVLIWANAAQDLAAILEASGAEVTMAESKSEMVELMGSRTFTVVAVDPAQPDSVNVRVALQRSYPGIPIVAVDAVIDSVGVTRSISRAAHRSSATASVPQQA